MGRIIGIGLIVLGIWIGMEVYTEGTDRAFGGSFARLGLSTPAPAGQQAEAPLDGVRSKLERARDQQAGRNEIRQ